VTIFSRHDRNEHSGIVGSSLVDRLPLRSGAGSGADWRAIMAQTHGRPLKRRIGLRCRDAFANAAPLQT